MIDKQLILPTDEFIRLFQMRSDQIAWFLGAGASAASGIKTAYSMIWDFKRQIYCTRNKVPVSTCQNLSDPSIKNQIQSFFDSLGNSPQLDADEEYSHYFEQAYQHETDRRRYIEQLVIGAEPSFGHHVLAELIRQRRTNCIFTTNFDTLVEDAVAKSAGSTGCLTTAVIESSQIAIDAIVGNRWPLLVKLHGDFRSARLKNTAEELQKQNSTLQTAFGKYITTGGLAVIGYSGRDQSVMSALSSALDDGRGFPSGLFWFHRSGGDLPNSVVDLIQAARELEIQAYVVQVETFDELASDIAISMPEVMERVEPLLAERRNRVTLADLPSEDGAFPALRLNAYPVLSYPNVCRRIGCDVGGAAEVQSKVENSGLNILAGRRSIGVIAFGDDSDLKKCFTDNKITDFDLHSIETWHLEKGSKFTYDSAEHALLHDAIWLAFGKNSPVKPVQRGRSRWLVADPVHIRDSRYDTFRAVSPSMFGTIAGTDVQWYHAVKTRLIFVGSTLWFLVIPSIWLDWPTQPETENEPVIIPPAAKEFVREKSASRYNTAWNGFFDAWTSLLFGNNESITIRALGCQTGVDAEFNVGSTSTFSRRRVL